MCLVIPADVGTKKAVGLILVWQSTTRQYVDLYLVHVSLVLVIQARLWDSRTLQMPT